MRVLGIDPGYDRVGIAVIEKKEGKETLLFSECFTTDKNSDFTARLDAIMGEIRKIIAAYTPETLAIENLFFSKNQKTAMRVAEARGAIISEALRNGLSIREFRPAEIKIAITGQGNSDKKQIIAMIPHLIAMPKNKEKALDDEYDAIAVAITCLVTRPLVV
jgi:crossover junction endodeoxyribonuclease RuvC